MCIHILTYSLNGETIDDFMDQKETQFLKFVYIIQ